MIRMLWPCKRFDFSWADWRFALKAALAPPLQTGLEAPCGPGGAGRPGLACLSVRAAFDLYLRVQRWRRGDEVIFSALTVPDMPALARRHGLTVRAVDIDPGTGAWDADALEARCGPRTRAVVVAHLFGARQDLRPTVAVARRRGVSVVEDCAQAYAGPGWQGAPEADLSLFSFGPMKTATALGGALAFTREPALAAAMRDVSAHDPPQPTGAYLRRVLAFGALQGLAEPRAFGALNALADAAGWDLTALIHRATRNVRGGDLAGSLRRRPCGALLAVLERRLEEGEAPWQRRRAAALTLLAALGDGVARAPTSEAHPHGYWMVPVQAKDGAALKRGLKEAGFDAMQCRLAPVEDGVTPTPGARRLAAAWCLPCDPTMPAAELRRLGALTRRLLAAEGASGCGA